MIPDRITPETITAWKETTGLSFAELAFLSPWTVRAWKHWCYGTRSPNPALRVVMADIEEKIELNEWPKIRKELDRRVASTFAGDDRESAT